MIKKEKKLSHKPLHIGSYAMIVCTVFFVFFPIVIMLTTSIMSKYEAGQTNWRLWPKEGVTFESYRMLLFDKVGVGGYSLMQGFFNTMAYYLGPTIINVLVSAMAAFAFAKIKFRLSGPMFGILMFAMMLPNSMGLIVSFLVFDKLYWINTPLPIVVPQLFGSISCVFFLRQFYMSVPDDLLGSAKIDGLGYFGSFTRIMLPISTPALVAQFILTFIVGYNDYLAPLMYLSDPKSATLQVMLAGMQNPLVENWPLRMASCVVAMVPLVTLYLIAQKAMLKGMEMSSGIKG